VKDEGNKVDYRDKPACNGVFAEFPSGHEEMLFALAIASNFSAVTRHNSRDKTDPEQSTRLAIAR
ncbi:MAG: hypothetical protein KDB44_15855, partial [Mycobacterium sp.]|nr:hypothetical protein [Mycobacterium sp.]